MVERGKLRFSILSIIILFGVLSFASAATLTAGSGQTYTTIQDAINAASAGDTIEVGAGTYELEVTSNRYLLAINKNNLIVKAAEGQHPIIQASSESFSSIKRIVEISSNGVIFEGFEIVGNGDLDFDGSYSGIRIDGSDVIVRNNVVRNTLTGIQANSIRANILENKIYNASVGISLMNKNRGYVVEDNEINVVKNNNASIDNEGFGLSSSGSIFKNNIINVEENVPEVKVHQGSIQDGINVANSGDTVYVRAGEYIENITINKPLVLRGATYNINKNGYFVPTNYAWNTSVESIIQNPDSNPIVTVVDIVSDDVVFEGFIVQSLNRPTNNDGNLLRLDASTGTANDGLVEDETLDNILIRNNIIGPNTNIESQEGTKGRMGLYFASPTYPDDEKGITNTLVTGNKIIDSLGNGNNIFVWGAAKNYNSPQNADYTGTIIEDNEISGSHRSGIEVSGGVSNLVIRNNWVHDQSSTNGGSASSDLKYGNGIIFIRMGSDKTYTNAMGSKNITIQDNLIEDNEKNAIYFGPFNEEIKIENNVIRNNGLNAVQVDLTEVYHTGNVNMFNVTSKVILKNNKLDGPVSVIGIPTNGFMVNAQNNYWGGNPNFSNLVYGKINYAPWFSNEEMTDLTMGQTVEKDETTNITTSTIENEINLTTEDIVVSFPAGVSITSDDTSWDGTILPPTIKENANVEPNTTGLVETVSKVIEVGFAGVKLILSEAVKITIPGEAGKKVGYSYGGTFYKITNECIGATDYSNIVGDGECYYDDGVDMIIWTKHFTEFVTYNASDTEAPILYNKWKYPLFPTPLSQINIFANFTDPSGIASALIRMNYHFVEGPLNNTDSTFEDANMTFTEAGESFSIWNYSVPMTPTDGQDGYFKIKFSAIDGSGNIRNFPGSSSWDMYVSVDGTPANTVLSLNGSNNGNYITSNTQIKLNATDIDWDGAGNYQPSGVNYSSYKIDSGSWNLFGSYTSFTINSSHSDGDYTIYYKSVDNATNVEDEKSTTLTLDNTKPNVSMSYPENNTYDLPINQLNYSASDSGSGLSSCWYNNGTMTSAPEVCGTSFTLSNSNEGFNHWIVYANDSVGNLNSAEVYFTQDTITPEISYNINTPANNSYLNVNSVLVNVSIIENNTDSVILSWNGVNESITNRDGINYWIMKSNLSDGVYSFNVFVNDSVGHSNSTETRIVTVDRTAPLVLYTTGTANNNANLSQDYVYVNTTFSDVNFANVIFRLYDSTGLVNSTNYTTQIKEITWNSLPEGRYSYNVSVYDLSGNFNSTETRSLILDRTAPTLEIVYPNSSIDNMAYLTVKANSFDSLSGIDKVKLTLKNSAGNVVLGINNSLMVKGTSSYEYTLYAGNLSADNYTIEVNSFDKAGNLNTTNRTFELKENVVPTLVTTINGNVPVATGGNVSFTFNINVRGNGAIKFGMDDIAGLTPTFLNATISSGNNTAKVGESDFTGAQTLILTDTDLNATNVQGTFTLTMSLPPSMTPGNYPINYYIDVA